MCEVADMLGRDGLRSFASRSAALRRLLLVPVGDGVLCEAVRDLLGAVVVVGEGEVEGEEEEEEEV